MDIKFDEINKGYDYYGPTVNTAARIEAAGHGGQVVCSSAVLKSVEPTLMSKMAVQPLGSHQLKDVTEPICLHQLLPTELAHRTFPTPRVPSASPSITVDPEKEDPAMGNSTTSDTLTSATAGTHSEIHVSSPEDEVFMGIRKALGVLKKSERADLLPKLYRRWNVANPPDDSIGLRGIAHKVRKALGIPDSSAVGSTARLSLLRRPSAVSGGSSQGHSEEVTTPTVTPTLPGLTFAEQLQPTSK